MHRLDHQTQCIGERERHNGAAGANRIDDRLTNLAYDVRVFAETWILECLENEYGLKSIVFCLNGRFVLGVEPSTVTLPFLMEIGRAHV